MNHLPRSDGRELAAETSRGCGSSRISWKRETAACVRCISGPYSVEQGRGRLIDRNLALR